LILADYLTVMFFCKIVKFLEKVTAGISEMLKYLIILCILYVNDIFSVNYTVLCSWNVLLIRNVCHYCCVTETHVVWIAVILICV